MLLPYLILRIIRRLEVGREVHVILQPSSSLVLGAFSVVFALIVSYHIGQALNLDGTVVVLALAVAAATAIKVPALFGVELGGGNERFYMRNASFFVLPFLTAYFVWKRGIGLRRSVWLAAPSQSPNP